MPRNKLALIHGYSDRGESFDNWASELAKRGVEAGSINICNYISLNNEITVADIAEGLSRAMAKLEWSEDEPYDAIVHSTGMLVIRAYLCNNSKRPKNLKHLVGLAPATWGSPLAHQGRSFLGAIFKGSHQFGPDFLNAGDQVLDALELGSEFTWDLAHRDLLSENPIFTTGADSPYVAVFIGNKPYDGIRGLVNQPGTDGTVRWAGCSLNSRKFVIDLRRNGQDGKRMTVCPWTQGRLSVPMFAVEGKDHGSLLSQPDPDLADRIVHFLDISNEADYQAWIKNTSDWNQSSLQKMKQDQHGATDGWQQFVFHVVDEYGNPVPDYVVDLFKADPTGLEGDQLDRIEMNDFDLDVHAYGTDKSYRCFHVRLPQGVTTNGAGNLWIRLTASSGTQLIAYQGYGATNTNITEVSPVVLNISEYANGPDSIFRPFTTTLVEIKINREPFPFKGFSDLMGMRLYH